MIRPTLQDKYYRGKWYTASASQNIHESEIVIVCGEVQGAALPAAFNLLTVAQQRLKASRIDELHARPRSCDDEAVVWSLKSWVFAFTSQFAEPDDGISIYEEKKTGLVEHSHECYGLWARRYCHRRTPRYVAVVRRASRARVRRGFKDNVW